MWYALDRKLHRSAGMRGKTITGEWHQCAAAVNKQAQNYVDGIIASATHRLNTSVLEGMNKRSKVLKRMVYGYRDNDYFL